VKNYSKKPFRGRLRVNFCTRTAGTLPERPLDERVAYEPVRILHETFKIRGKYIKCIQISAPSPAAAPTTAELVPALSNSKSYEFKALFRVIYMRLSGLGMPSVAARKYCGCANTISFRTWCEKVGSRKTDFDDDLDIGSGDTSDRVIPSGFRQIFN
jgi:hypothetical protein